MVLDVIMASLNPLINLNRAEVGIIFTYKGTDVLGGEEFIQSPILTPI